MYISVNRCSMDWIGRLVRASLLGVCESNINCFVAGNYHSLIAWKQSKHPSMKAMRVPFQRPLGPTWPAGQRSRKNHM